MNPLDELPAFEIWLAQNKDEIAEIIAWTRTKVLPTAAGLSDHAAEVSQKQAVMMGFRADISQYVTTQTALVARDASGTVSERKIYIEDRLAKMERLKSLICGAVATLRGMGMEAMSLRKATR